MNKNSNSTSKPHKYRQQAPTAAQDVAYALEIILVDTHACPTCRSPAGTACRTRASPTQGTAKRYAKHIMHKARRQCATAQDHQAALQVQHLNDAQRITSQLLLGEQEQQQENDT